MVSGSVVFLGIFLVVGLMVGMVALVMFFSKNHMKKITANYQMLADRLGLRLIAPPAVWYKASFPRVSGDYEGRRIDIETEIKGHGKQRQHYTKISLETRNEGHSLQLTKEYWISNVGKKLFGAQDIQVNDPFFDKKFIIRSDNEMFAKRFFNQEMKRTLTDFHPKFHGEIVVEPFKIYFTQIYQINSLKQYNLTLDVVDMLNKIANRVEGLE